MVNISLSDLKLDSRQRRLEAQRAECEKGFHSWSNWACVPAGLGRECQICGKTELLNEKLERIK